MSLPFGTERKKVQRQMDADLALLESTGRSARPGTSKKEIEQILAIQKKVRKARRAGRLWRQRGGIGSLLER